MDKTFAHGEHRIAFIYKGDVVGICNLPPFNTTEVRHDLARILGIDKYTDFWFINPDGSVRMKASELYILVGEQKKLVSEECGEYNK
jgi:hypothetical protein